MEADLFSSLFNTRNLTDLFFKIVVVLLSLIYLVYSVVIAKQIKVMDKTLQDKSNQFLFAVNSVQTTVALILLIFSLFLV